MHELNHILLHLSLIDGIGPATIQVLREHKPENMPWAELYNLSIKDLQKLFDLGPVTAQNLFYGLANDAVLLHELALIERHKVTITTIADPEYPVILSHINAPPAVLYCQGADLSTYAKCIAIIGARTADRYGQNVIESMVPPLVAHGWSIVSGGALGADAMAHAATLKAGGKTIVVLGSGLLHAGPPSNVRLFENILANDGTLLSIFRMDMQARPELFPNRNRIIAGLSRGVIVAQAARKSGTRITAQFALEQGRDVFAVPGLIDHPLSEGCHALIQEGAKLISRVEDVLAEYDPLLQATLQEEIHSDGQSVSRAPSVYAKATPDTQTEVQLDILSIRKQKLENIPLSVRRACPAKLAKPEGLDKRRGEALEGHNKIIHSLCKTPISLEDLMQETKMQYTELQTILFNMQLDGIVQQNFAGLWETQ